MAIPAHTIRRNARWTLENALHLARLHPPLAAMVGLTILAQPTLTVAFVVGAGRLVERIPALVGHGAPLTSLLALLAVVAAIFLVQQVLPQIQSALVMRLKRRMDDDLRERVTRVMLAPANGAHLEDPKVSEQVNIVTGFTHDGDKPTAGALIEIMTQTLGQWLTRLALFGLAGSVRWWLGLLLGVTVGGFTLLRFLEGLTRQGAYDWNDDIGTAMRRAQYFGQLAAEPDPAKEVRVFELAGWLRRRWELHTRNFMDIRWRRVNKPSSIFLASLVLGGSGLVAAFALLAVGAAQGSLSLGQLAVAGQIMLLLGGFAWWDPVLDLSFLVPRVPTLREMERELLPRVALPPMPAGLPHQHVRLESITFAYPEGEAVLRNLDLSVPAHRSLAIVGENGAGKTTLVKLLCRLLVPQSGRITVDGLDLAPYNASSWQRRVAAILQDFVRYPVSARDNIRFGHVGAQADALEKAARRAGALEVVEGLPQRWATILSREFGGTDLSGGEWQRIALSRALLAAASGATLLILDEPAANLDVRAEAELNRRFLEMTRGLTTIVISHRLSTVRRADRIVVLEAGRVVEEGDHASLLREGGRYAELFNLQAAMFRAEEQQ